MWCALSFCHYPQYSCILFVTKYNNTDVNITLGTGHGQTLISLFIPFTTFHTMILKSCRMLVSLDGRLCALITDRCGEA